MAPPLILVVDDEPDLVELVTLTLSRMQLATQSAGDVASAKKLLKAQHFDLCLTDMRLPDGDGLDLLEWMGAHCPGIPCAVITAHGNVESAVRALKLGAFDFVSKPLDLGALRRIVSTALKLAQTTDSGMSTRTGTQLIGNAPTMDRLREMILRVSRSQAPVHIFGESGTGKELVARMIHSSGPRAEGPFVPVNCGAIPSELMESEFFGHKRGSFTGAVTDKIGLIPSAEGGTLFLDEVADLPLHMQVKLLRVIQEKSVRPIGEQREAPIDVRILSATHKNLVDLVSQS
jgi:two-component system response regulator PilR (NtrC family)